MPRYLEDTESLLLSELFPVREAPVFASLTLQNVTDHVLKFEAAHIREGELAYPIDHVRPGESVRILGSGKLFSSLNPARFDDGFGGVAVWEIQETTKYVVLAWRVPYTRAFGAKNKFSLAISRFKMAADGTLYFQMLSKLRDDVFGKFSAAGANSTFTGSVEDCYFRMDGILGSECKVRGHFRFERKKAFPPAKPCRVYLLLSQRLIRDGKRASLTLDVTGETGETTTPFLDPQGVAFQLLFEFSPDQVLLVYPASNFQTGFLVPVTVRKTWTEMKAYLERHDPHAFIVENLFTNYEEVDSFNNLLVRKIREEERYAV